ncbi:T9SS-dependent choice-of-anchor J family protein [Winogradskyella tangerina]|uniref:T9SS-dependent choice-of-anchor J family protein n=1 Tax=Winogradskyella tangerina TaxID=2023240 RepID=UPI000DBE98A2|nr:choice-of-anchor J domain-containing protein [Winogradskyella tangerina]
MNKIFMTFVLALLCFKGISQTTIYTEDFTNQVGKGAIGSSTSSPTIDLSGVDWTIDVSNATLSATTDYFSVVTVSGNQLLEGRDLDVSATWFSPNIDISDFTNVGFTINVSESNGTGGNNLESTDTVLIEYRIDSGTWTTASTNGSFSDDYDLTVSSETGLLGSNLEIRVTMTNNGGGERQRIDDIEVTGTRDCNVAYSLPFNEGFEGGVFPPECWQSYRGSNGLGTVNDWTTSTLVSNSGTTSAFVEFEVVSGGNAQDWLVTPAIDLGTAQTQLRFFAREQFTIDFNTEYSIRISQTSATDISSFTTIQTYNESQLGNTYNEKTVDLSAYSGVVYIAFVMEQNDGDNWFLDDVSVVELPACTIPDEVSNVTVGFDDSVVNLNWALGSCYDDILVVAKEGSPVTTTPTGDGSSYTADSIFGNGTEIATDEFVVFNSIGSNVDISNVSVGNTYHFSIFTRKGTTWSTGVPISITLDYCTVSGDTAFATAITLVDFGDINNITGQGSGYDDFTAQSTSIERGESEDLTVNLNTDGDFRVYSYAWIDWNADGDFDDAGETYDLGESENTPDGPTSNSALTITAPVDAVIGDTRLRVLCQYFATTIPTNGPCDGSTDGEIEDYTITVLPGITYVYDDGWSPADPNGVATLANPIQVIRGNAVISTSTQCESVVVDPAASLTVNTGVTLDIANSLDLESTSIAFSSLILDGTINGTINYLRHVNSASGSGTTTGNNDLISPPLQGQTFGEFTSANPNILSGTIGGSPAFLFGTFDSATSTYLNFTPANNPDPLATGIGYRTGSTDNGTYTFTGTVETGDVEISVTNGGASNWNLIGNPYPSYINVQSILNETTNRNRFDENAVGIYGYDGSATDGWTIYNLANTDGSTIIAPGQGFFIDAETSGTFRFTPSMRMTGTSDDFILGRNSQPLTFLKLQINDGSNNFHTDFYFNDNASLALDEGYDASVWNSTPASFSVHSYLVENDNGRAMAIQALHSNDVSDVTIPLGINVNPNQTVVFSIQESTLPNDVNVYLEDVVTETTTLLNDENYEVVLDSPTIEKGRFYLRFVNQTLSVNENTMNALQIFTDQQQRSLTVKGQLQSEAQLKLYDLQGRVVNIFTLKEDTTLQTFDISELPSGIYVADIQNQNARKTQKIILR